MCDDGVNRLALVERESTRSPVPYGQFVEHLGDVDLVRNVQVDELEEAGHALTWHSVSFNRRSPQRDQHRD